jgi:hypothetical protein
MFSARKFNFRKGACSRFFQDLFILGASIKWVSIPSFTMNVAPVEGGAIIFLEFVAAMKLVCFTP